MRWFPTILFLLLLTCIMPASISNALFDNDWSKGVVVVVYGSQYGTGWWVSDNTLVTAAHVVNYQNSTIVQIIRGDWSTQGTVIIVDSKLDIAVIKTPAMPLFKHIFPIATEVKEMQQLYVIGYPFELVQLSGSIQTASETPRIAEGFAAWYRSDYNLIEFQATTDAGNSGGPVVYGNGAVAGLVSFAMVGKAGTLYFASDANAIKQVLDHAGIKYQLAEPSDSFDTEGIRLSVMNNPWTASIAIGALISIIISALFMWSKNN